MSIALPVSKSERINAFVLVAPLALRPTNSTELLTQQTVDGGEKINCLNGAVVLVFVCVLILGDIT